MTTDCKLVVNIFSCLTQITWFGLFVGFILTITIVALISALIRLFRI